jgi:hypothetical protein
MRTAPLLSLVLAGSVGLVALGAGPAGASVAGCPVLPADHILNARIDTLPVHPRSDQYVSSIGLDVGLKADFGAGTFEGAPIGIPFNIVPGDQPRVPVTFEFDEDSDVGPYPIPSNPLIEGAPGATSGDRHILMIDRDACVLYELFAAVPPSGGAGWTAGSGAIFGLRSNALRPATFTSADAAGLPIFPTLARFEEVQAGEIRHALRFTAQDTQRLFVWPARHFASDITDPAVPPMGQRFRLKASVDISGFPPQARVVLQALKTYGLILADNGSNWFITGAPDEGWINDELQTLGQITGRDFEAVDVSGLLIDPDSGQANLVSVAVNQGSFAPGEILSASVDVVNPGSAAVADFYLGLVLPDGESVVFFTEGGGFAEGRLSDLASFRPIATAFSLAAPFAVRVPVFFAHQWVGTEPRGRYILFLAALSTGALADGSLGGTDLLAVSATPFTLP